MRGIVDFSFDNVKEGNPISCSKYTIDNGKTWHDISTFGELIKNWDTPIMFVRHLNFIFTLLQPEILKLGYKPRYCKDGGKGWHSWPRKLKEDEYEPRIWGEHRNTVLIRFANVKLYNADKWINAYRNPFDLLTEEEYKYLDKLSEDPELKQTPASNINIKLTNNAIQEMDIHYNLQAGVQGGVIDLFVPPLQVIPVAYHYDITSMYPYILYSIDKLPLASTMTYIEEDERTNHKKYAYWILDESEMYRCNVSAAIAPAGSIKARLSMVNPYKTIMEELFQEKNNCKKGTPEYNVAKIKINSAIGLLNKRGYNSSFYPYVDSDEGRIKPLGYQSLLDLPRNRVCEYTYIIAKARHFILNHMAAAEAQGAQVLQVNTDGFFTDKPIKYDEERFLGSLRQEYVAHNLTFFACNQYACDEEVCISGLPRELYVPNKLSYSWPYIEWNRAKKCYVYSLRRITLGGQTYE